MKKSRFRLYIGIAISVSITIALFIHLNSLIDSLFGKSEGGRGAHVFRNIGVTAAVSFCTFLLNYYLVRPLDSLAKTTKKEVALALIVTLISVTLLSDVFFGLVHSGRFRLFHFDAVFTIRDLIISLVILGGILLIKVVADRQNFVLENERLTRENLQTRYESLKNQLSPHFLFNSLSALKSLIGEKPSVAENYVDHLSQVLRHSLEGNKKKTVALSEELDVVNSYIFLVKMRYDQNLEIENSVDARYLTYRVPPLTLQTLVENAVKHNVISKKHPLTIRLFIENNKIVVVNTLKEKYTEEEGTGIGLSNLASQYALLGGGDIQIIKTETEFRVELPLLDPASDESGNR